MTGPTNDWLQTGLVGTLLASFAAVLKFTYDVATGKRTRRVADGEAELRLAEMVKRVAADEVETLTERLGRAEARGHRAHDEITNLHAKVDTLERDRLASASEIAGLQLDRVNAATEIAGLQRRIVGVIDDRDDLVRVILNFRAWYASGAKPPAPVIPAHLADVVPKWIPVDGAEPPARRARPGGID